MAQQIIQSLWPSALATTARSAGLERFMTLYGDTLLLLVRLPRGTDRLAQGLAMTLPKADRRWSMIPPTPLPENLTEAVSILANPVRAASQPAGFSADPLRRLLSQCPHFIVPLRKRPHTRALAVNGISIGRALDSDIVLHDPTVSKFQGWFQADEDGTFTFTDAGGANAARVNGRRLSPATAVQLAAGDIVKLGKVEAIVSPADTLWMALRDSFL